jgi:EAL domain-containing protein (putative c-di-GMP-specific phosphodiesterase class I)
LTPIDKEELTPSTTEAITTTLEEDNLSSPAAFDVIEKPEHPNLPLQDNEGTENEIPPLPANPEEPEVFVEDNQEEESAEIAEIEGEVLSEIEEIEAELEKLEKEIVQSDIDSEAEFVPESEEEKKALAEIELLEVAAKKQTKEADKLAKEILPPPEDADMIETYVPEYQKEPVSGEVNSEEEEEEKAPAPIEEETEDLQAELERIYETGVGTNNSLKIYLSKINNQIFSFKSISTSFQGPIENFRYNKKIVFRFAIKDDSVQLYCALDPESIDNNVYPHKKAKGEHAKATATILTVSDETSLRNAGEIITLVAAKIGTEEREHHVPVAYAERYPINPNGVLLGQENKPPIEGQYSNDDDYAPISGEIVNGIIEAKFGKSKLQERKDLKGKEVLEDLRQTANTIKAAVALTEPVVYFFDSALNKEGAIEYLNIQQVLNDKFLGKIVPQVFFAVAEGSDRIEKFNFLSLEFAVEQANAYASSRFVLALSCRLLIKDAVFERLIRSAQTLNDNLVLAFDCALLESLGNTGLERIRRLRNEAGVMIMIDNSENAGMRVLTEYDFEYIRFDSRFYAGDNARQKSHLEMMTGYAKSQNIKTTSVNVLTLKEAQIMVDRGVDVIQGPAASEPKRIATLAMKAIKKLPFGK